MQADVGGTAVDLRTGKQLIRDDRDYGDKSLEGWSPCSAASILTRKGGAEVTIPIHAVGSAKLKVFLQIHEYNAGANVLEVTLGDQTQAFR